MCVQVLYIQQLEVSGLLGASWLSLQLMTGPERVQQLVLVSLISTERL